jgi:hypothetical protein
MPLTNKKLLFLAVCFASSAYAESDCPTDIAGFTALQNQVASQPAGSAQMMYTSYSRENGDETAFYEKMTTCFPEGKKVPACLQRAYDASIQAVVTKRTRPFTDLKVDNELNMRRPPDVFFAKDANGQPKPDTYQLFQESPYKDAETIAKENGWPYVRYKSRHSGGFDSETPSLLMIRVPGEKRVPPVDYDQYINIALPADEEDKSQLLSSDKVNPIPRAAIPGPEDYKVEANGGARNPKVFTIMTVKKATSDQPASIFFNLFSREGSTFTAQPPEALRACYSCHPNGMRAISPLGFHVNQSQATGGQMMEGDMWKRVQEMNASMNLNQKFRLPDFGKVRDAANHVHPAVNPNSFGPVYGPVRPLDHKMEIGADGKKRLVYPTRTKDYIVGADGQSGCANSRTSINVGDIFRRAPGRDNLYVRKEGMPVDWQKVKKAMNCASCHNNQVHGALTAFTDPGTLEFKILVDQSMPVGAHQNPLDQGDSAHAVGEQLNLNERIALVNCLEGEFKNEYNHMGDWIKEVSCSPKAAAAGTSARTGPSDDPETLAPAEQLNGGTTPAN